MGNEHKDSPQFEADDIADAILGMTNDDDSSENTTESESNTAELADEVISNEEHHDAHKPKFELTSIYPKIMAGIIAVGIITGIGLAIAKSHSKPEITVEQITDVPDSIAEQVEADKETAGFYQYDALGNKYVLLTFGETSGLAMSVTPNIDGKSVYFAIGTTEVVEDTVDCEYQLYKTDAESISADETKLKNPAYGVGSEGINVGWVERTENGAYFITPIMDTSPTDRVFDTAGDANLSNGLYSYTYQIQSSGAFVSECTKISDYTCHAIIDKCEDTTADILLGDQKIRLKVDIQGLDDASVELLNVAKENDSLIEICLTDTGSQLAISKVMPYGSISNPN